VRSNSGVTSANYNVGTGTTSEFFAYTRSTGLGTITITNGGSTFTFYIRGTAGPAYTIAYTPNAKPFTSTLVKQSVKITDVFGNAVAGVSPTVTPINLTSTAATSSNADGISEFTLTYPSTAGQAALSVSIPAVDVLGFDPAVKTISTFIDVTDANGEIAKATAAVAAEKAALVAEKAARAADKVAADAAVAAEKAALATATAARATDKIAADSALAAAATARTAEKAASDAALAAEKGARATEKIAADKALADEKAARAADKAAADKALADEKAARAADKAANDKALATLTARVTALTKQVTDLKALYNKLAVRFKQKTIN